MKKSLTENLTTSKQRQQRTNARKNKVAFLAMREDISEALEKGGLLPSYGKRLEMREASQQLTIRSGYMY